MVLVKKGSKTREYFAKAREESALAKRSRYSCTNVREVHEMRTTYCFLAILFWDLGTRLRTTMVAVRIRIGIYIVRELRDNTVANFAIIQSRTLR